MEKRMIFLVAYMTASLFAGAGAYAYAKQGNSPAAADDDFCTPAGAGDFTATGAIVNAFLDTVEPGLDDEAKITALKTWVETKDCVSKVEIFCVSCIKTYPLQSELLVTFDVNGEKTVQTLDISMGSPPRFAGYHDAGAGYATPAEEAVRVYFAGGILYVNSPAAETVAVYSADGALLRQMQKLSGAATFDLGSLPEGVLIAKGSSGWTGKIANH
ncbi:MAG: hypothetical protein LBK07_07825 [Tannerella sp.]|nr:hypothetical protein [Tannerella sp.]